jgi:hypothetical protein
MDVEELQILAGARAWLAARGWCQGAEARDASGRPVHPQSDRAVAWSASGAIYRASGFDGTPEVRQRYERAVWRLAQSVSAHPSKWNDTPGRDKPDVLAALDRALLACGWTAAETGAHPS